MELGIYEVFAGVGKILSCPELQALLGSTLFAARRQYKLIVCGCEVQNNVKDFVVSFCLMRVD